MLSIQLNGVKDIQALIKKLPEEIRKKALTAGARAGGNFVAKEARKRAPRGRGKRVLSTSRGIASRLNKRATGKAEVVYSVSWLYGKGHASYGHLVEFGHKLKYPKQLWKEGGRFKTRRADGQSTVDTDNRMVSGGTVPAKPHLVPAFRLNIEKIQKVMFKAIETKYNRVITDLVKTRKAFKKTIRKTF